MWEDPIFMDTFFEWSYIPTIKNLIRNGLFSIGEDAFRTRRMTRVCKLFGRYKQSEREFFPSRDYLCTKNAEQDDG